MPATGFGTNPFGSTDPYGDPLTSALAQIQQSINIFAASLNAQIVTAASIPKSISVNKATIGETTSRLNNN